MSKILITSGCSFTETAHEDVNFWSTWPAHLYKSLENFGYTKFVNGAMGSQGNGLISRSIIYHVSKALETYNSSDILVGVMWSGSNRVDYRCPNKNLLSFGDRNTDGWIENPTGFVDKAEKKWVILNAGWTNLEAQTYYKYFHDYVGSTIYSIEHILRTQYYLKSKNIKYFFSDYVDNNIVDWTNQEIIDNKHEFEYLLQEIDKNSYLPISSEHQWVYENSKTKHEYQQKHNFNGRTNTWIHPNKEQHKEFVDNVIMPFIKKQKWI
jgi:hypothetical protein